MIGQTFPNRAYFLAGTSFGHLTTSEIVVGGGYKPITGTIFDRMDAAGVSWKDYCFRSPLRRDLRDLPGSHAVPWRRSAAAAAGTLPAVSFIDPSAFATQTINGHVYQTDEHPPNDIRAGEYFVSQVINALRNRPSWNDSILFWTYDEHGGFYDHVKPPPAPQGGARDAGRHRPGTVRGPLESAGERAAGRRRELRPQPDRRRPGHLPGLHPDGPLPGRLRDVQSARVPRALRRGVAVLEAALRLAHHRARTPRSSLSSRSASRLLRLTARDADASTLEDMFDFDNSPSLSTAVSTAPLPMEPGDNGCPF